MGLWPVTGARLYASITRGVTPQAIPSNVTVCVTSCGRVDLLRQTLGSFRRYNLGGRYLLSEDSTDGGVLASVKDTYPDITVLWGIERLGITRSIDRLYSAVETPYIFHLEDDWGFDGPVDWQAAIACLNSRDDIANVCVRSFDEIKKKWRIRSDPFACDGRQFRVMHADAHHQFFGWSPNPGLIKTSLYKKHAPFGRTDPDRMSYLIKNSGRTMAFLLPGVARHIGQGRHVNDPTMPLRRKSKARIRRAVRAIKIRVSESFIRPIST